ncbi:class I SAM-dependent methyltransferase [Streptomyces sp. NBC_00669]|uniref:class I SAM-dependent methyltransferase n=1 Tax=Streptomyces sp. NBC_00669 TaxID=2976011 RepID=UPI002E337103|nr:class I SAM-dependent methyltransferase [Streptomyces sp. NBC_00669]
MASEPKGPDAPNTPGDPGDSADGPESSAERVALWRALHVRLDAPPHVFVDEVGLRLVAPPEGWRDRPDMDPEASRGFRAAIVSRARFIEDLVAERAGQGVDQYVILGAGLDTFAQREPEAAARLTVFEVDQPAPQAWKRRRLDELGYGVPAWLRLVPVDFEAGDSWLDQLVTAGFDRSRPAVFVSAGVTMYLTREATEATLRQIAALAPGTTLAMTFQLPTELVDPVDRPIREATLKNARASRTPFISFYAPHEMLALARTAGFPSAHHVSGSDLCHRYFTARPDALRPSTGEDFLITTA